jgi:signal transduction histidine kinase
VQALKEMRLLVHQLQPSALQQEGLLQALQKRLDAVEKRSGLDATIAAEGNVDLAESIEMNLYLLALEALNNALKHSGASKVAVSLKMTPKLVEMSIEDNGSGFDLVAVERKGGMGLANMQARVVRMGGTISILPASETGTRVTIKVDPTMVGEFDSSQEAL